MHDKPGSNRQKPTAVLKRGENLPRRVANPVPSPEVQPAPATLKGPWRMPPVKWAEEAIKLNLHDIIKKRRAAFFARVTALVLLPTLLVTAYVFLYASPRYVSEFQVAYQSNDPSTASSGSSSLLSSILGTSGGGPDMQQVLGAYFTSTEVLDKVSKKLDLRRHYSDSKIDWLDRLNSSASDEKFLTYFNRRVSVSKPLGEYVVVDVEAFDPKFAQAVGAAMVDAADQMVAQMVQRARDDAVALADRELKRTQDRLRQTTQDLTKFRNEHNDVNLAGSTNALDTVVSSLESQLSQANSDLTNVKTFLADNSPTVISLKAKIAALQQQIDTERKRLGTTDVASAGATGRAPYSQIIAAYAALQTEQQFATDSYVSAKKAYDLARAASAQKGAYVVSFVPPNLPQSSTSPDPTTYILSTFLVSLFVYMAGSLLIGAFRDQAGI